MTGLPKQRLRVGFVGSGFIAEFHLKGMLGVRNVDVTGVFSRKAENRARFATRVAELGLGDCTSHDSLESLVNADNVDAIWILSPNYTRLDVMRTIHAEVKAGRSKVIAVACEKPLARTVAEAREMLRLAEDAGLNMVISKTRCSARLLSAARTSSGAAPPRPRDAPIWPVPQKSIPARTSHGSGRATSRAAACSPT